MSKNSTALKQGPQQGNAYQSLSSVSAPTSASASASSSLSSSLSSSTGSSKQVNNPTINATDQQISIIPSQQTTNRSASGLNNSSFPISQASSHSPNCNKSSNDNNSSTMPRENIRSIRNQAEKQRRDKLNGYINELAANVPFVTQAKKRQDKTSVLRLAAAYIRIKQLPINPAANLSTGSANLLTDFVDSVPGFVLIANCRAKIMFVSPSVERILGHQDNEVIGHSLDNFLHPSDIENAIKLLNHALRNEILQGEQQSSELNFMARLKEKNQSRTEVTYRQMRVTGHLSAEFTSEMTDLLERVRKEYKCGYKRVLDKIFFATDTGGTEETITDCDFFSGCRFLSANDISKFGNLCKEIIFLGHVEEIHYNPETCLRQIDIGDDEYMSRHSLDGTLLYADHRIASILGFLPKEVAGKSAYDYILPEDYSIALFAHKLMLSSSNGTGVVVHRLTGVDNSVVFLQTMGCLKFNKNGLVDHFACVSRMLKESDGERELEKFVNRFTPHIQNKSPIELYESMQMDINPLSSQSFSEIASEKDSKLPTNWPGRSHKRLLPARFERYARDQHNVILQRRNQSCSSSVSSPQTQIFSAKIEEPNNEQILKVSMANNKCGGNTEQVAMQNKIALQKSIRNLNERSEFLMVKSQHQSAKGTNRKRAYTASQDMDLQKKAKHSNPNNTFIRSFISADKAAKKPGKSGLFKSEIFEECLHKSKSISGIESLPESNYKLAHGQADYTHMLGARVFTYNHLENANVLSIYTPPSALQAQQRGRLIGDGTQQVLFAPASSNNNTNNTNQSNVSGPSSAWQSSTNQHPQHQQPPQQSVVPVNLGPFFETFDNSLTSPYLNLQTEHVANSLPAKGQFGSGQTSLAQTPTDAGTPDLSGTPLCEELESGNIGCQLDAMQRANNAVENSAVGPSTVNFHHHHHHLKRSSTELNEFNSDSRSPFSLDYSESTPILPVNVASFSQDDSSNGIVDYLSQIEPTTAIFPTKICETDPLNSHSRNVSSHTAGSGSNNNSNAVNGSTQNGTAIFVPDGSRNGDNSYPSSGQTNTNYSPNTCYQYSVGPPTNGNGNNNHHFNGDDFTTKSNTTLHSKLYHGSRFGHELSAHTHDDPGLLTAVAGGQSNLYGYSTSYDYDSHFLMEMEAFPAKSANVDGAFSLNQPENSYDITEIVHSVLYSSEIQFPITIHSDAVSNTVSDIDLTNIITGKRINNSNTPTDNRSSPSNSEEIL